MIFFSLPVLMYHGINRHKHRLCVSPEFFEEHCRSLAEAGWRGISLQQVQNYYLNNTRLPQKSVLLTFDDGYLDNYVYAEPILRKYGHHGVLFPVLAELEEKNLLRPTLEDLEKTPDRAAELPDMHGHPVMLRHGRRVTRLHFCAWPELGAMHLQGNLQSAPHSLKHNRAITNLNFTWHYSPTMPINGYFSAPPYQAPWGFPAFPLGHSLADRNYIIRQELFDLVQSIVPQDTKEAQAFLSKPENRQRLHEAIAELGPLGTLESKEEFRTRLRAEFEACREIFVERLGEAPKSFCWPWGFYSRTALREGKKAGFKLFFVTMPGPNFRWRPSVIHRIAVEGCSGEELVAMVKRNSNIFGSSASFIKAARKALKKHWPRYKRNFKAKIFKNKKS